MNKNRNITNKLQSSVFWLLALFTLLTQAQVTTKVDTTRIRIGEQIQLKYIVDKQDDVQFPNKLVLDSLQKMEVVKSFSVDTIKNQLIKKYTLTSFDSGRYKLPEQLIFIKGKKHQTKSVIFNVSTVAVDTTKQKLFPIKAIHHQQFTVKDYAKNYWYLWLIIPLIFGLIWWFFIRKKETEEEKIAKIPPFEMAVKLLDALDKKLLWQNNKTKEYYSELTDILRTYIEKEFKVPALESTTSELVHTLKKFKNQSDLDISNKIIIKLKDLLKEADLVKFAKSKPYAEEIQMHRRYADEILEGLKSNEIKAVEESKVSEEDTFNQDEIEYTKENLSSLQNNTKIDNSEFKNNTMNEKKKSNFDKKKIVSAITGTLFFFIAYYTVQHFVFNKNNIDKMLIEVVNEINKTCPITLDKDTRLNTTQALPDRTLQYNYSLVNLEKSDINIDDFKNYMKKQILNTVKTNPDMKYLRDKKVNFAYSYSDKNNEFVLKIVVTPKMYLENDK